MEIAGELLASVVIGQLLLTLIIAVPLAFITSLALLHIYRRAVKHGMLRRAAPQGAAAGLKSAEPIKNLGRPPGQPPGLAEISIPYVGRAFAWSIYRYASVYLLAGLAFSIVMTLSYLRASGLGFDWLPASYLVVTYAWPVVITLCLVATLSWRGVVWIVLGYSVVLAGIIAAIVTSTSVEATQMLKVWLNTNLQGSVLALIFLARPIRAVGPLVAAFMIAAVAGALTIVVIVGNNDQAFQLVAWIGTQLHLGAFGTPAALLLTGAMVTGIAGWTLLRFVGSLYRGRWVSDQSIVVDALWLMFTLQYGIALTQTNPIWFLAAVVAFITYKIVSCVGFRLLSAAVAPDSNAPKLLLLRVFSLGARSERLFENFAKLWLYRGSIRMIAGPDLVTATVQPHQFLDFLAGRLNRNFISSSEALAHRLEEAEPNRDFDGRFRTASFFCHDDMWQLALKKLTKISDAVLMDLRGFTAINRGCLYEIEELLEVVELDRILFVIDKTTDAHYLNRAIAGGWEKVTAASPNWSKSATHVHIVRLDDQFDRTIPQIVAMLLQADRMNAPLVDARA